MDERVLQELLSRLDRLEGRVADQEERLLVLERLRARETTLGETLMQRKSVPMPEDSVSTPREEAIPGPPPVQIAPAPPPIPPAHRPMSEYDIGAKILPKAGAAVLILALAYLVSLAVGRGLITPAMLWWGVGAVCLAFIGVGQRLRDEREEFGQILTAVGSCGLYLNFAAGHVPQNLYGGATLVSLFLGLSLLNLLYSLWRSSKVFLALGLFGGLIASLMPLQEDRFVVSVALHFLVVIPSTAIVAKRRWVDVSYWLWGAATAALLGLAASGAEPRLGLWAVLGSAVVTLSAHARAYRATSFDPQGVFAVAAGLLSAGFGFLWMPDPQGSAWLVAYGLAMAGAGMLLATEDAAKHRMALVGLATPALIGPMGFDGADRVWVYFAASTGLALLSRIVAPRATSVLAAMTFSLGSLAYLAEAALGGIRWQTEAGLLVASIALVALVCWRLVSAFQRPEGLVVGASVLAVPLVARLAQVVLGAPSWNADPMLGLTAGFLLAAGLLTVLVRLVEWESAEVVLGSVLLGGLLLYGVILFGARPSITSDLLLALGFAAVLGAAAHTVASRRDDARDSVVAVAASVGGLLFTRLVDLLLAEAWADLAHPVAFALGSALAAAILGLVSVRRKMLGLAASATVQLALGGVVYAWALASNPLAWSHDLLGSTALLLALPAVTYALSRSHPNAQPAFYVASFGAWALITRIGLLLLDDAWHLGHNAAVSTAWIVTAVALLILGFVVRVRHLRYMSFVVMAATAGKVMLVDLASLDPIVRVGVLVLLGMAMLAVGYWYIRVQALEPSSDS